MLLVRKKAPLSVFGAHANFTGEPTFLWSEDVFVYVEVGFAHEQQMIYSRLELLKGKQT